MAQDIFLNLSGIVGEAQDAAHAQQIDVLNWEWAVSQSSRCLETLQCSPVEIDASREAFRQGKYKGLNRHEMTKSWPDRLPSNIDSIGIELVGMYRGEGNEQIYEDPTSEQNDSLKWLIAELIETLSIDKAEVYAHPAVSYKNPTEAKAAQW
ncbi:hypothetical protein BTHE68_34760 [Burkholderia sp. THE68]|uniref:type VI secretion system tube protein Hcp n=1 Tax=Burkholderia sp. THE68 TaxID=758782 RepID=UPI00131653A7|nr:type VI secretion system tube protein Hcp [Burkholderia sp. THE68]BBU29742.1 hypothetical protein BTHE68_34760 [Burkholderia sp. THE68]